MTENSSPYGPSTPALRRFLQKLASVSPDTERLVVDRYHALRVDSAFQGAERVLGGAISRSGREKERDALGGPLLQMMRRADLAGGSTESVGSASGSGDAPLRPLAEPALAALLAVMMQDVLTPEQVARLYEPFEPVISRASLF